MNKLLSIETSAESCSVALSIFGKNSWEKFEHAPRRHAELILPMVSSLLAEAELALSANWTVSHSGVGQAVSPA